MGFNKESFTVSLKCQVLKVYFKDYFTKNFEVFCSWQDREIFFIFCRVLVAIANTAFLKMRVLEQAFKKKKRQVQSFF